MIARLRRLSAAAPFATSLLLLCLLAAWATAQPTSPAPAPPAAGSTAKAPPIQKGLPPELVVPADKLDAQRKRLELLQNFIQANKPPSGIATIPSKIGAWVSGLFSGQKKAHDLTVSVIVEAGRNPNTANQLTGQLVSVEGLWQAAKQTSKDAPKAYLLEGDDKLALTEWAGVTKLKGFDPGGPDGMPALVTGTLVMQAQGHVLQMQTVTPAPTLTLMRLARVRELTDDPLGYQDAVKYYRLAAVSTAAGSSVWSGFALCHSGWLAEEKLRDGKLAIKVYQDAWNLEGRALQRKSAMMVLPHTWVLVGNAQWVAKGMRETVGDPLDALERTGFWYRFVATVVAIAGGNAGIGMILLAVITRALLWPLTTKQIASSKAMQRLQPQIKALQEKHGADKQKFQEDFWKLCRANNVNPFGGCLPLLIQMPLLWMVYSGVRAYTVQLSHFHFLWIHSLADPDLPLLVLYTISMIAFQKLTMKTQPISDPQQQQQQNMMVWMMPLMFFVFFQSIASGFILYWLGTNLIYLPQQYFSTRTPKDQSPEAEGGKERVITLEPGGGPGPAPASPLSRLAAWFSGEKPAQPEEGKAPASYEQKKVEEKREERRSTRKRRRRP